MPPLAVMPTSLEEVRIKNLPASAYYIADFITPEEEQVLLDKIQSAPKPRWKHLSHRRLQTWPSDLTKHNTLLDSPLPAWLMDPIVTRLGHIPITAEDLKSHIFSQSPHGAPNHVLINEYQPGEGIMPHKDGDAYYPVVCTISLGSSLTLGIYGTKDDGMKETEARFRILQEPRSLLITTDDIYKHYLHGIAEVKQDVNLNQDTVANWSLLGYPEAIVDGQHQRCTRASLTYRDVLKVSKLGITFAMLGKR